MITLARTIHNLVEDLDVYAYRRGLPKICLLFMPLLYPTTWPVIVYRVHHYVFFAVKMPFVRQILLAILFCIARVINVLTSIEINRAAVIDQGIFIPHLGNIVVAHNTVIGKYASIHQGVTFGNEGRDTNATGMPNLGDSVYVGAGAKIVGGVKIGNGVMIGCNAVVVKDIPENATAVGVPARVINSKGSKGCIHYRKQKEQ